MKTKVLLVYPEIPTTYWSFKYSLSFVNYKSLMPPLGLLTVASMLPYTYEVNLVDMNIKPLEIKEIIDADIVFVSAMIIQKKSFEHVVRLCSEFNKTVVAGGPYPTSCYKDIAGVDHFVLNEAELTLPDFLRDYANGSAGKIYKTNERADISATPVPRFDLIEPNVYSSMALQFSRGCPFNCEFCDIIELFGRIPRTKSPEQFLTEMDAVYNTEYRGPVFIVDDNFIGNKNRAKELLTKIIEWQDMRGYPFTFFTEASINLADDDELLNLMTRSGFNMVFVGIETPVTETLAQTNKAQNLKHDMHESIIKIQKAGIEVLAGFIVGFDTDPENIFELQQNFIQKAAIPLSMIGILIALPNTQLYRRLLKEDRITGECSGNNTYDMNINFIPKMPKDILVEGYKKLLSVVYSPKKYFDRSFELIKRMPVKNLGNRPFLKNELRALFLSLYRQIFSKHGYYYLKFLARTLLQRPKKIVLAINLAIKGYHFFKMTDEILHAKVADNQFAASDTAAHAVAEYSV